LTESESDNESGNDSNSNPTIDTIEGTDTDLDSSDEELAISESDEEKEYEIHPRKLRQGGDEERDKHLVPRLPIKLPDGSVKPIGQRRIERASESPPIVQAPQRREPEPVIDDVATGARFGRLAVIDVIRIESRERRIHTAKEQLASICQDIIGDPENNVSL
jgi:nucleolar complex protein 3